MHLNSENLGLSRYGAMLSLWRFAIVADHPMVALRQCDALLI